MIRTEDIQELLSFDAENDRVVSLYLDADTSQQTSETVKLQVRSMLRDLQNLDDDAAAIERYLDFSHDWGTPGLALFSCAAREFFRAFPSAIPYRNRIRTGRKPHVKPLTHLTDHYAHYGVVVVDRVGARFFEYHLGELKDAAGNLGDDVRKLKHGGGSSRGAGASSATGQRGGQGGRHEEEVAQRNLREAADAAQRFFAGKPIRRLFLGGTAENVAQFRDHLSKQLQSRLAGSFAIDKAAGEHEIRQRALELLREANAKREEQLVKRMITTAAKGGSAVVGLEQTLRAVGQGRVQTLIISEGYRMPGFVNEAANYLTSHHTEDLNHVEGELLKVDDVVEAAVSRTMEWGGQVEIVDESQELEEAGRIGALLRY